MLKQSVTGLLHGLGVRSPGKSGAPRGGPGSTRHEPQSPVHSALWAVMRTAQPGWRSARWQWETGPWGAVWFDVHFNFSQGSWLILSWVKKKKGKFVHSIKYKVLQ